MTTSKINLVQEKRFDNGRKMAVLMISGGIDSTTLAYKLRAEGAYDDIHAFFINLGVPSTREEYNSTNRTCIALGFRLVEADFSWYRKALGGIIPAFENDPLVIHPMLSEQSRKSTPGPTSAAVYAETIGCFDMYHGVNKDDLQRYKFMPNVFKHIEEIMTLGNVGKTFKIHTPWISMSADDVIVEATKLNVPLENTWSCWSDHDRHCGICGGCKSRKMKFANASKKTGIVDRITYEQ